MQAPHAFPSPSDATPEPKSGPNWPKILGIGCAVAFLLLGLCFGGIFMMCKSVTSGSDDAEAFLLELRTGDHATAYARMSPAYRAGHDQAAFEADLATMPPLTQHTAVTFTQFNLNNGVHSFGGMLATPQGPVGVRVTMVSSGGIYYVQGIELGGQGFPGL